MRELPGKAKMQVGRRSTRLALEIGGCTFGLWCEPGMRVALDREHEPFLVPAVERRAHEIECEVEWADALELPKTRASFESGGLWSAYREASGTKFFFSSEGLGQGPYKAAWFDESFSRGHVVLNRSILGAEAQVFPLEYPIDELVMMHRLALGDGMEVHALGLADEDGSGYLFLGHSGAGKSTTARLWMKHEGVTMLSDDRIILRKREGAFWMYGTPWHGDAGVASAAKAPLRAIFFLEQFPTHEIVAVPQSTAAAELFARAFLPHYVESGIDFTLRFVDELTKNVPCSIFRFAPTDDAVEAIRHAYA